MDNTLEKRLTTKWPVRLADLSPCDFLWIFSKLDKKNWYSLKHGKTPNKKKIVFLSPNNLLKYATSV